MKKLAANILLRFLLCKSVEWKNAFFNIFFVAMYKFVAK